MISVRMQEARFDRTAEYYGSKIDSKRAEFQKNYVWLALCCSHKFFPVKVTDHWKERGSSCKVCRRMSRQYNLLYVSAHIHETSGVTCGSSSYCTTVVPKPQWNTWISAFSFGKDGQPCGLRSYSWYWILNLLMKTSNIFPLPAPGIVESIHLIGTMSRY